MQALDDLEGAGRAYDEAEKWFKRIARLVAAAAGVVALVVGALAGCTLMEKMMLVVECVGAAVLIGCSISLWLRESKYMGIAQTIIRWSKVVYVMPVEATWHSREKKLRLVIKFATSWPAGFSFKDASIDLTANVTVEDIKFVRESGVTPDVRCVWFEGRNVESSPVAGRIGCFSMVIHKKTELTVRSFPGILEVKD